MLFKVIMYYALAKGARKGLKGPLPLRLQDIDKLLKQYYLDPIREQLNKPMPDFMYQPMISMEQETAVYE